VGSRTALGRLHKKRRVALGNPQNYPLLTQAIKCRRMHACITHVALYANVHTYKVAERGERRSRRIKAISMLSW
jgi:hypothetical protein